MGRDEQALQMDKDVYSGRLKLNGEEHETTLRAASNYASSLNDLSRFEEARLLLRKTIPVARRGLGDNNQITVTMRWIYAQTLYMDDGATLDDLREAVTTLEDAARIARRVLGPSHPTAEDTVLDLQNARAVLAARDVEALRVGAMRV